MPAEKTELCGIGIRWWGQFPGHARHARRLPHYQPVAEAGGRAYPGVGACQALPAAAGTSPPRYPTPAAGHAGRRCAACLPIPAPAPPTPSPARAVPPPSRVPCVLPTWEEQNTQPPPTRKEGRQSSAAVPLGAHTHNTALASANYQGNPCIQQGPVGLPSAERGDLWPLSRRGPTNMKTMQIAAVAAVITGAAVGLAGSASAAEPLSGSYRQTTTDSSKFPPGSYMPRVFTPCGPDCTRDVTNPNYVEDFHLQGSTWTFHGDGGNDSFDANSLAGRYVSDSGWYVNYQLTRD